MVDRSLSFRPHVEFVASKARLRSRILACLASKDWGWDRDQCRAVFLALVRSVLDYAGGAWQPFLAASNMTLLDRAQNAGLRRITGQFATSNLECLRLEAGVPSYATTSDRLTSIAYEKALRLPATHPRSIAAAGNARRRLVRSSWRDTAQRTLTERLPDLNGSARRPFATEQEPPWSRISIPYSLVVPGAQAASSSGPLGSATNRLSSIAAIRALNCAVVIYTDGSARDGTSFGGAAAVVTSGDPASPVVIETLLSLGRRVTSSYDEEIAALHLAADWLEHQHPVPGTIAICSDSQAAIFSFSVSFSSSLDSSTLSLRRRLSRFPVRLQWVPSHCGVPGNELADAAAKAATALPGQPPPITYNAATAYIKRQLRDPEPLHERTAAIYGSVSRARDRAANLSRSDSVLLSRLRAGHCRELAAYASVIDPAVDPICSRCGDEPFTLEHWLLRCPALALSRLSLFGTATPSLAFLGSHPKEAVLFARRHLL